MKHVKLTDLTVENVLTHLKDFEPKVVSTGSGGASKYIAFKDTRLGQLRISNHSGREKYRFKWNLWTYGGGTYEEFDRGVRRFHFRVWEFEQSCDRFKKYAAGINRNTDVEAVAFRCGIF